MDSKQERYAGRIMAKPSKSDLPLPKIHKITQPSHHEHGKSTNSVEQKAVNRSAKAK